MAELRIVPGVSERVETGPLQFGDDWPGVFIRGDDATRFALALKSVLEANRSGGFTPHPLDLAILDGLLSDLMRPVKG